MQQTYALSRWVLACVDMQGLPSRLLLDEMAAAKDVDTALTAALKVVSCPWKHSFALVTSMMLAHTKGHHQQSASFVCCEVDVTSLGHCGQLWALASLSAPLLLTISGQQRLWNQLQANSSCLTIEQQFS